MKVGEIMSRHVEFIAADASVQDAAMMMGELDVGALPVGTPDRLDGIITDRDLVFRVLAEGRDPRNTKVLDVATRTVFTCSPDDALSIATDLMAAHNVRRLPVVEADRIVGWLTLADLSRTLLVDSTAVQGALKELSGKLTKPGAGEAQ